MVSRPASPTPEIDEILIACARGDAAGAASLVRAHDPSPRQLVEVTKYHGLLGTVSALLRGLDIPQRHAAELDRWHKAITIGQAVAALDLELLARVWADQVTWTVIKGPALGRLYYPDPTWRMASDLDVIVPRTQMDDALARLATAQAGVEPVDWHAFDRDGIGEVSFPLPRRTALDLHWELIHEARERRRFRLDGDAMNARRVPITLEAVPAWTFDDEDTLIYVALHAMLSANTRLGWTLDVHRIVTSGRVDWATLVSRCDEYRLGLVVAVQLARARGVLGTPVTDAQLDELSHARTWRRVMHWAEGRFPAQRTHEPGRHGQLLRRSTSTSTMTSMATLARLVGSSFLWPRLTHVSRLSGRRAAG